MMHTHEARCFSPQLSPACSPVEYGFTLAYLTYAHMQNYKQVVRHPCGARAPLSSCRHGH